MQTKAKEKINIVTLGCAKNLVDSEVLLTQLKGNNKEAYHQNEEINPDVVIVNTCGFIDNAKQESIDTILSYAKQKDLGNIKKLFVILNKNARNWTDLTRADASNHHHCTATAKLGTVTAARR